MKKRSERLSASEAYLLGLGWLAVIVIAVALMSAASA